MIRWLGVALAFLAAGAVRADEAVAPVASPTPSVSTIEAGPPAVPNGHDWQVTLYEENDSFFEDDANYTQGFKLLLATRPPERLRSLGAWLPPFDGELRSVALAFGHSIYTPYDWLNPHHDPFDRPYAGWMYVGGVAHLGGVDRWLGVPFESFWELDVGVVGPSARGEQVQDGWHRLVDGDRFAGWRHQLPDEPGLLLTWQRSWLAFHRQLVDVPGASWLELELDLQPHVGLRLGNIATWPNAGLQLRLGHGLRQARRWASPFETFGEAWSDAPPVDGRWFLYARLDARWVLRDEFLDGTLTRASPSIEKERFVADLELGAVIQLFDRVTLGFGVTIRTPQFEGQPELTRYGAATLSVAW